MSGLMARIRSRRADGPPGTAVPVEGEAPATEPTVVAPDAAAEPAPDDQATAVAPVVEEAPPPPAEPALAEDAPDVPAGAAVVADDGPSFRDRGRLRRRLRYLRRVRELGFRDLGGLVFDLDRFGREKPELVRAKLDALGSIDGELRALEAALQDERPIEELQEPGITACAHCGAIHGSDANFCPACGRPAGSQPEPPPPEPPQPEAAAPEAAAPETPAAE